MEIAAPLPSAIAAVGPTEIAPSPSSTGMVGLSVRSVYLPEVATVAREEVFAFAFSAVWVAVEMGLFASEVLSTLPSPTSLLARVTTPVLPATEVTGAAG
jgi:hypothetical protein